MNRGARTLVLALGSAAAVAALLTGIGILKLPWGRLGGTAAAAPAGQDWTWNLPHGFPPPVVPADNPMTEAKFQLGRHLFHDRRLSGNGSTSCSSCHLQHLAFTDGRAVSPGATGEFTTRSSMSIANVAYYPTLTWSNPSQHTLEIQAAVPMFVENQSVEMGITDENKAQVLARFAQDADYRRRFAAAFPGEADPVSFMNIIKAIAAFERGVISGDSKYDRAQTGKARLNEAEQRGQRLFFSERAQCASCHSGFNFSDQTLHARSSRVEQPFHNTGLYNVDGQGAYPSDNPGLIGVMPQPASNMGRFRVVSLRNIAVTAPYMHDGSIETLEAVLDFYAAHGRNVTRGPHQGDGRRNPFKDPRIDRIQLDARDKADLIAFLKTLTDESFLTDPRYADPFAADRLP